MQNIANSIVVVRSFVIFTFMMVTLLKRSMTSGGTGNYYCKAWVVVDSMTSNTRKHQDQTLQIGRLYHQQKQLHQWHHHNIPTNAHRNLSFNPIRPYVTNLPMSPTTTTTSTTAMTSGRNNGPSEQHKNEINQRIYDVAKTMCHLSPNQITITWKSQRIVVTVHTENAFLDTSTSDGDDNDENEIEIDIVDEEDFLDDDDEEDDVRGENTVQSTAVDLVDNGDLTVHTGTIAEESMNNLMMTTTKNDSLEDDTTTAAASTTTDGSVDLTLLARSINVALDDGEDGIGTRITEQYEIEVSTPGITSDDITTPRMFAAYRGFDVIVHYLDPKKKVLKQHEGRLVEKNEEHVIINQKGRMKHFKNIHVQAVKLPKFKSEKGSR